MRDGELPETAPEAPEPAWNDAQIGRYLFRRLVGSGGMGVVVAAHDPDLDRDVAIKLVVTGDDTGPLREAQAMARLSHPHVVQVYEVIRIGDRTAIVMELVEGEELGTWQRGRPWREIVDAYVQASRGLAAAHRAGIVHRDFKPTNVLVDRHGVVRVTDFGLARSASSGVTEMVGTPVYMAPEQHRGGAVDARTDQWGLACSLYEALHGRRPFASSERAELAAAVVRGGIDDEPADSPIPRRIRQALRRALAVEPDDRFASVEDFAAAVTPTPSRRPYLIGAAVGGVVVVAAALLLLGRGDEAQVCQGLGGPIDAVWTPATRADLRTRLLEPGVGVPQATVEEALQRLDTYTASWTAARGETCRDAQQGVRSAETLDARMRCLDRGLAELSGLLEGLAAGDPGTLRAMSDAVTQLHPIAECAQPRLVERPTDPTVRRELEAADDALARASAAVSLGQFERAMGLADRAMQAGERADAPTLTARALVIRGECEDRLGRFEAALASYQRAAKLAARGRDHAGVADALARAALVEGDHLGRRAIALAGRPYIDLAVESAGQPDAVRAEWLHYLAILLYDDVSRVEEAAALEREALAILERTLPANHVYVVDSRETLGNIEAARDNFDESVRLLEQVLAARIASRGPNDRLVSSVYNNLGLVEVRRGEPLSGLAYFQRAIDLVAGTEQPNWPALYNLAETQLELGRWRAAAENFAVALAIAERVEGEASRDTADAAIFLGVARIALGDVERGRASLVRGIEAARRSGSVFLATALAHAARLAVNGGDLVTARALLDEAQALPTANPPLLLMVGAELARREGGCAVARPALTRAFESAVEGGHRSVQSAVVVSLAACEIAAGDVRRAKDRLDLELAWLEQVGADAAAIAPVRATLSRAQL